MPLTFTVVTTAPEEVKADLLAVPVGPKAELGPGADVVDAALDGNLGAFMKEAGFEGKPGQALVVPTLGRIAAPAALLVGVGAFDEVTADGLRRAGATVARRAKKLASVATTLLDLRGPANLGAEEAAGAFAEGIVLGTYQFLKYKDEKDASKLKRALVVTAGGAAVKAGLDRGAAVANAVAWARDIVNEPAGAKSPAAFANLTKKVMRDAAVTVKVLAGTQLETEKLGGVIGVGQGSDNPPRFVKLTYSPAGAKGTLALVGKGVVFDSGGLSIKTSGGMETMKTDMSGAAAVIGAMSVLRKLKVKTKVVGYVPMVENMPSGSAIRPGDVLRIRNGKTVEVLNTDAEGRLILADGLSMAAEDKPDAVVDLATLTGACMVALGDRVAGLMGNQEDWIGQVRAAADRAGEAVWPLPLPDDYRKLLDSEVADLRNIGTSNYGGALTAGLFLSEFAGEVPWAHLDIAGPARAGADDGYVTKGGTGFGVRTIVELADSFAKPPSQSKRTTGTKSKKALGKKKSAAKQPGAKKKPRATKKR